METVKDTKLPFRVKLAYTCGYLGKNFIDLLNMYFLLFFYTDVVGIPAGAAAIVMLIARIWDAINDPIMGVICDKKMSKEGKCRWFLKRFSVPAAVATALCFFCPEINTIGKIIWVTATYLLQDTFSTILYIPLSTLTVRLTDNRLERVRLGQFTSVASIIVNVAVPAITLPLVKVLGGASQSLGFLFTGAIFAALYGIGTLITYWGTKGYEAGSDVEVEAEKPKAMELIKTGLKNKYALVVSGAYIFYLLNASIMSSSLVYYFTYYVKNTGLMSVYSTAVTAGSVIVLLIMGFMHKKFGNAMSCVISCILCIIGCAMRWVTGDNSIIVFIAALVLLGFGSSALGTYARQCIYDACSYGKLKTGVDNQAIIMTIYSFAQKVGQAMGGVVAAWLLSTVPYVPNAETQVESVQNLFFAENIIIPLAVSAIAGLIYLFVHRYEKDLKGMLATKTHA